MILIYAFPVGIVRFLSEKVTLSLTIGTLTIFTFLWVNFLYGMWPPLTWNIPEDFMFTRTGGAILYGNHLASVLVILGVTTYFILKKPLSEAYKVIFVTFSAVSIHELLLDAIVGQSQVNTVLGYFILNPRWIFWLSFVLTFGLIFSTKTQRWKMVWMTMYCVGYDILWLAFLTFTGHSPLTIVGYQAGVMFFDPIDNLIELGGWIPYFLIWLIPDDLTQFQLHFHNVLDYLIRFSWKTTPFQTTPYLKYLYLKEADKEWEHGYVPEGGLEGKTVLDVGAGSGETAYFFFTHGVKKVIAVEPDPKKVRLLEINRANFDWNMEIIPEKFKPEHLMMSYDFAKIDAEKGEAFLLNQDWLPNPLRIEIHTAGLAKRFRKKFPQLQVTQKYHWPFRNWEGRIG